MERQSFFVEYLLLTGAPSIYRDRVPFAQALPLQFRADLTRMHLTANQIQLIHPYLRKQMVRGTRDVDSRWAIPGYEVDYCC